MGTSNGKDTDKLTEGLSLHDKYLKRRVELEAKLSQQIHFHIYMLVYI